MHGETEETTNRGTANLRSIVLPFIDYPSVSPMLLMKSRDFPYGNIMVVAWFQEIMTHVTNS
jgi:hypothetical protein